MLQNMDARALNSKDDVELEKIFRCPKLRPPLPCEIPSRKRSTNPSATSMPPDQVRRHCRLTVRVVRPKIVKITVFLQPRVRPGQEATRAGDGFCVSLCKLVQLVKTSEFLVGVAAPTFEFSFPVLTFKCKRSIIWLKSVSAQGTI
jgi:hypothetical protein